MIDIDKAFTESQKPESSKEQEAVERLDKVNQLVRDVIGRHAEFFADPENRLEFVKSHSAKDFYMISQYVNAKLRGERPHELRLLKGERAGGSLPMMHTPKSSDKPKAFSRGYAAIQEYLATTTDSIEKQIEGVAMATEALIIWVHPFVDGNGRTSRFMAKLIEDGATDIDALAQETAFREERNTIYKSRYMTKESMLADANNEDLMLEDDERDEMRQRAEKLPSDPVGMYLSIKRLLDNDDVRSESAKYRPDFEKAA